MYEKNILFFGYNTENIEYTDVDNSTPSDADDVYSVEYASSTDSQLYTVQVVNTDPLTTAEQSAVYLLEIRNILLIFLLCWLVLSLYSKIKNTFTNYFGKE